MLQRCSINAAQDILSGTILVLQQDTAVSVFATHILRQKN